jgi:hypothetical protein
MMEIDWILTSAITVNKVDAGSYLVREKGGERRTCTLSFVNDRLLFDGVDIETEDFMAYVGLTDMVDDGVTDFEAEEE